MPARVLHLAMLLFISLWFGVIAPGHTRGVIKMGAATACGQQAQPSQDAQVMSCCAMPADDGLSDDESSSPKQDKPADAAACCAVCYLNATMQTPEVFCFTPGQAGLIAELAPLPLVGVISEPHFSPIRGRAPPRGI